MKYLTYCVTVTKDGDPDPHPTADEAYEARATRLRDLVQSGFAKLDILRAKEQIASDGVVNAARPLYVFAAPEWLFRVKKSQFKWQAGEYYQPAHRQKYRELLAALSSRGDADVLIMAGSMLWIQPLDPTARRQLADATEQYVKAKDVKYGTPEHVRPAARVEREAAVLSERKAIVEGAVTREWLGYNEGFAYFNGAERKSVLKSFNSGDFDVGGGDTPAKHVAMVYGLGAGSFSLDIGGGKLRAALAICFDHSRPLDYGKSVDLYILVSCSQPLSEDKKYVKDGGLILHADCHGWGGAQAGAANKTLVADSAKPFELVRAVIDTG